MSKKQWIDFRALRRELKFEQVLSHYGVEPHIRTTEKGRQHSGTCPLQTCREKSKKRTFSANLDRGIWQCFACKQSGNALDFIALLEGLDPSNASQLRQAAEKARETFLGEISQPSLDLTPDKAAVEETPPEQIVETVVNAPLDFELQSLDPDHPWFRERKLSRETVAHFGLGFCARGWLKGRIAIPIRTSVGLVGYAGRLLDEKEANPENPIYIFPQHRVHKGVRHEFQISEIVYHLHEVRVPVKRILVTPFPDSVWTLWQEGIPECVSIMGTTCYPQQMRAFVDAVEPEGVVWIVSEEDDFPTQSIAELTYQTAMHRKVRWCSQMTTLSLSTLGAK